MHLSPQDSLRQHRHGPQMPEAFLQPCSVLFMPTKQEQPLGCFPLFTTLWAQCHYWRLTESLASELPFSASGGLTRGCCMQTLALDIGFIIEDVLRAKGKLLRGLAHPAVFAVRPSQGSACVQFTVIVLAGPPCCDCSEQMLGLSVCAAWSAC